MFSKGIPLMVVCLMLYTCKEKSMEAMTALVVILCLIPVVFGAIRA
jgi:hypothetical protein